MESFDRYVGQVFDKRYRIDKVIGIGGMSVVFRAYDTVGNRVVAVKMLKDDINNDSQSIKRFVNESKAVSMLSHPNIVKIFDVSVKDNLKYIVMEHIDGITLKTYMNRKGALAWREVVSFSSQILTALAHAHEKGIIHRDIKPQNIMLLKDGLIKVTDFGIAKLPEAETVTMTDKAIGTVYYISPEQASGKAITPRSDIYSLGAVMYEMACGQLPFYAESPVSVALMQVNDKPVAPREINPQIPTGLEQIILEAMQKDPNNRYADARQMLAHLQALKENPGIVFKTRPRNEMALVGEAAKEKLGKTPSSKNTAKKKGGKLRNLFRMQQSPKSLLPMVSGVASAFLLTAIVSGIIITSQLITNAKNNKPKEIEVENVVGLNYQSSEITEKLPPSYYKIEYEYVYDKTAEDGIVLEQKPTAGSRKLVKEKTQLCTITLKVSRGEKILTLSDYTITEYRTVQLALQELGINSKVERINSDTVLNGYVVRTDPAPGTEISNDTQITLYVSSGPKTTYTLVPNFVGSSQSDAMRMLIENSLALGKITWKYDKSEKGTVLEQSLTATTSVPAKVSKIDFVLSLGPEPVETTPPDTTPVTEPVTEPVTKPGSDSKSTDKVTDSETKATSKRNAERTSSTNQQESL